MDDAESQLEMVNGMCDALSTSDGALYDVYVAARSFGSPVAADSRVIWVHLDTRTMTATLVRSFEHRAGGYRSPHPAIRTSSRRQRPTVLSGQRSRDEIQVHALDSRDRACAGLRGMLSTHATLVTTATITRGGEVGMAALIVFAFLVLIGPLSYLYGVDSRRIDDRGWVGGPRS
jgi:hypothetical protein